MRKAAYEIVSKTLGGGRMLTDVYREYTKGINSRDASLIKELSYGTVRYKLLLDFLITEKTGKRSNDINKRLRNLIRMSVYQLEKMNKKEYGVVDEAVQIANDVSPKGGKFVNWILREYLRNDKEVSIPLSKKGMYIAKSFPQHFTDYMISMLGEQEAEHMLDFYNTEYNASGFNIKDGVFSPMGRTAEPDENVYIMDPVFYEIMKRLSDLKVQRVLDCCSAPGGKAVLLNYIFPESRIDASDRDTKRLKQLKHNTQRLGLSNVNVFEADFMEFEFPSLYDLIVIDAPCSATGTIRKNPDVKYKYRRKISSLTNIQYDMLCRAGQFITENGYILYMTCSVLKEENQMIIDRFVSNNKSYKVQWEYFSFGNPYNGAYGALLKNTGG